MFAHLQVHMQGDIHYSPAHKGAFTRRYTFMAFFNSAVTVLQTLVIALGAGLGIWGVMLYK